MTVSISYIHQMCKELEDMRDKWKTNALNGFGSAEDAAEDLDIWITATRIRLERKP